MQINSKIRKRFGQNFLVDANIIKKILFSILTASLLLPAVAEDKIPRGGIRLRDWPPPRCIGRVGPEQEHFGDIHLGQRTLEPG